MKRLVLWDIDGTLLTISPVGIDLTRRIICELFELPATATMPSMAGRTDQQILFDALALHGLAAEAGLAQMARYQQRLAEAMHAEAEAIRRHGRVFPGVFEALAALQAEPVVQTLLTGNLQPVARLKLDLLGLLPWLNIEAGAYGSDHHLRPSLLPIAVERTASYYGRRFAPNEIVVIGDTPHDIDCAHAHGARAIAVAGNRWSAEELRAHGADIALNDLRDTEGLVQAIMA